MTQLSIGHFLRLYNDTGKLVHSFQNFYIGETVSVDSVAYAFVPFGFSGLSTSRQGDLSPTTLVFPNTSLSRGYLDEALRGGVIGSKKVTYSSLPYVGEVDVNILEPDTRVVITKLLTYTGQATAGGWGETELILELSSVIDAVRSDIPTRTLQQALVGGLPTTSNVRLR